MRTHLEFLSDAFPAYSNEEDEINPGIYGKRLAEFLAEKLPGQGFTVLGMPSEDWGWLTYLENEAFPL